VSTPEANVQFLEEAMNLIEQGDQQALHELIEGRVHADAELVPLISLGVEGVYEGPEGVRRFFDDLLDAFEVRYTERELRSVTDGVVLVLCRMGLRGRESGAEIVQDVGTVYEFEDSQFLRARVYDDQAVANEAAERAASAERSSA
jgi:ketosteroid isomerase-like protein